MPTATTYTPGSDADFAALYSETYPRLVRSVAVMLGDVAEAEDVVQDAYARAYDAWPRWHNDAPAEAWLWRITMNVATSRIRYRRLRAAGEIVKRIGRPQQTSLDPAVAGTRTDLGAAMAKLQPREAATVVMRHVHGYSNIEIAAALECDVRTVTRLLGRATERLRTELGDAWQHSEAAGSGDAQ